MLSWIVLIVLMGLFGVVFFAIFASVFGRGEQVPPMDNTVNVNALLTEIAQLRKQVAEINSTPQ